MATSNLNNFYFKKISESEFFTESDRENNNESSKESYNILDCFNNKEFDEFGVPIQ